MRLEMPNQRFREEVMQSVATHFSNTPFTSVAANNTHAY